MRGASSNPFALTIFVFILAIVFQILKYLFIFLPIILAIVYLIIRVSGFFDNSKE